MIPPVLSIEDLTIDLPPWSDRPHAVEDISLEIMANEILCVVGESGSGKSILSKSILQLLPAPHIQVSKGRIFFNHHDLLQKNVDYIQTIRGSQISMIFQEPMTSLNPVYTVGEQIAEVLRAHQGLSKAAAWLSAIELLDAVRIPNAKRRVSDYPFQMSGGQRQRVMIAIALACEPKILIADEPTTALDVTVQAEIFDLLNELKRQTGTAIIMITHDMGAVAEMAERMIVMYAGRNAEQGPVEQIIEHPRHPYTKGLISCVPHIMATLTDERHELTEIAGIVPPLREFGQDRCLFASRCSMVTQQCLDNRPPEAMFGDGRRSACWHAEAV